MSEWNWLPIEQAPKDRPILVVGGERKTELDSVWDCDEPTKVVFDYETRWKVRDTCYYAVWVVRPTHFCELPTPPKNLSADLAQKPTDPEESSVSY